MQVPDLDVVFHQEVGQVFRHALGQGGHQYPLLHRHPLVNLRQQIVHLCRRRAHLDFRVQQAGRPHHLLHHLAGVFRLVVAGGGRHKDHLRCNPLPFLKPHGPVIQCRRQPEAVFHQGFLPGAVALIHGADLRNGYVGLVHHQQGIGWQVIEQGGRRLARGTARQIAGVVLDTVAVTQLHHHFHVVAGTLFQPLGFHQPVVVPKLLQAHFQLRSNILHRIQHLLPGRHVVGFRVNGHPGHPAQHFPGERIEVAEVFHLVVEQLNANGFALGFSREHIDDVAAHPVIGAVELDIVTGVLQFGQPAQDRALINLIAAIKVQHHLQVGFGITQTIDGRHRGHDNGIRPLQQRLGGRQAHLLDVFVDGGVFLDKGVGRRHIGFRLVVIVVRHEILHRVIREELLELAV